MLQVTMKLVSNWAPQMWFSCVVRFMFLAANVHVMSAHGSHWWNSGNQNYQNQIGGYQDGGDGFRLPDHGFAFAPDSRTPKDIMVDVINNMGLALLEAHNENNDNNIAISPYGATSVMIALFEGLVGEAAYEIKMTLQLPPDLSIVRIGLRDIHRHLKSYFIPKEGFLAGLTLSHDNITLNREYQSILKFYGYDIESFNNPIYPDTSATSSTPAVTKTTEKRIPTAMQLPETTTELMTTIIDKLSTIPIDAIDNDLSTNNITMVTTQKEPETSTTQTATSTRQTTTTTETSAITRLPASSEEGVEDTTMKRLPTRSYTTEPIAVTDPEGRTETFYPMTTEDSIEILTTSEETTFVLPSVNDKNNLISTTTFEPVTNKEWKETTSNEIGSTSREDVQTEKLLDYATLKLSEVTEGLGSFKTTDGVFSQVTTYAPQRTPAESSSVRREMKSTTVSRPFESTTTLGDIDELVTESTPVYPPKMSEDSTLSTTFEGTTFFAMETADSSESIKQTTSFTKLSLTSTSFPLRESTLTTSGTTETTGTTETADFETLTQRDIEMFSESNQKLIKLDDATSTMNSISDVTFTTTEPITAYTHTQNTEATSLEDLVLSSQTLQNSSSFKIDNKITSNHKSPKVRPQIQKRSVVDYLIARYYDNYFIHHNDNGRYIPTGTGRTHHTNYQPEQPYTFLVNGQHKETNISFMTYDTILPFYYIRSLDAMALSFPLDSNMYYLLLVLPLDPNGIDKLVYNMRTATSLRDIVDKLVYTHVKAVIPSFMLKGYVVLTPSLQKLCIRKIFEPRHANFSPMTPERNLYVTNIEQAVTVTIRNYVDPASHSARTLNHYRPVEFRVDHPFLYFVMDSQIHVNLMAGKILNPLNSRIR